MCARVRVCECATVHVYVTVYMTVLAMCPVDGHVTYSSAPT